MKEISLTYSVLAVYCQLMFSNVFVCPHKSLSWSMFCPTTMPCISIKFSPPCTNIQCLVFNVLYHRDITEIFCTTVTDMRMLSLNASQGCINQLRALCTLRFDIFIWTVLPNWPNLTWLICWVLCSYESTCLYTTSWDKTGHGVYRIVVCHHIEVTTIFIPAMHMDSLIFIWMYSTPLNKEEVLLGCCFLNTKRMHNTCKDGSICVCSLKLNIFWDLWSCHFAIKPCGIDTACLVCLVHRFTDVYIFRHTNNFFLKIYSICSPHKMQDVSSRFTNLNDIIFSLPFTLYNLLKLVQ